MCHYVLDKYGSNLNAINSLFLSYLNPKNRKIFVLISYLNNKENKIFKKKISIMQSYIIRLTFEIWLNSKFANSIIGIIRKE